MINQLAEKVLLKMETLLDYIDDNTSSDVDARETEAIKNLSIALLNLEFAKRECEKEREADG